MVPSCAHPLMKVPLSAVLCDHSFIKSLFLHKSVPHDPDTNLPDEIHHSDCQANGNDDPAQDDRLYPACHPAAEHAPGKRTDCHDCCGCPEDLAGKEEEDGSRCIDHERKRLL